MLADLSFRWSRRLIPLCPLHGHDGPYPPASLVDYPHGPEWPQAVIGIDGTGGIALSAAGVKYLIAVTARLGMRSSSPACFPSSVIRPDRT